MAKRNPVLHKENGVSAAGDLWLIQLLLSSPAASDIDNISPQIR